MFVRAVPALLFALALAPIPAFAGFDEDGLLYVSPAGAANNATGMALALQPDGGFYVAGTSSLRDTLDAPTFELRRFDADGNEDAGFGVSQQHEGTMNLSPRSLLVQPDGAVISAITLTNPGSPTDGYTRIRRHASDGGPAPGFDEFSFDPSLQADRLDVLALQADGRILATGYRRDMTNSVYVGVVARLLPNGHLDVDFGTDGYVTIADLSSEIFFQTSYDFITPTSVNLLADGRIVVIGTAAAPFAQRSEIFFVRLLPDGSRDPSFNGGDPKLYAHRDGNNVGFINGAGAADVSPEGVMLVGGRSTAGGDGRACLLQFDIDGALMAEECDSFGASDSLSDVQLLPNGGAVGVGSFYDGSFTSAALMAVFDGGLQFSGAFSGRFTSADHAHMLFAVAFDPHRNRLISLGSGVTEQGGLYSNRWALASDTLAADLDATPDPIVPAPALEVQPGADASATYTLTGLDRFVRMPARVSGGRLSVNGVAIEAAADTLPALGFYTAFEDPAALDAVVSHGAPLALDASTQTVVEAGGVVRSNNLALTIGPVERFTFASVTRAKPATVVVFSDDFETVSP